VDHAESLWSKAKSAAKSEGKSSNWAYIMSIFKRMLGESSTKDQIVKAGLSAIKRLKQLASGFDIDVAAFLRAGIPEDVQAIHDACTEFEKPGHDVSARAYISHTQKSFEDYGVDGVKTQILYFLINAAKWSGPEAREAKKVMKKWATKK
jgi:hypothetical protein